MLAKARQFERYHRAKLSSRRPEIAAWLERSGPGWFLDKT
jgi:hypothetical protein